MLKLVYNTIIFPSSKIFIAQCYHLGIRILRSMIERFGSRSFSEDRDRIADPIFKSRIGIRIGSKIY